jgi:hypothetical protein
MGKNTSSRAETGTGDFHQTYPLSSHKIPYIAAGVSSTYRNREQSPFAERSNAHTEISLRPPPLLFSSCLFQVAESTQTHTLTILLAMKIDSRRQGSGKSRRDTKLWPVAPQTD